MDFLTQDALQNKALTIPTDALGHELHAAALLRQVALLPVGAVVAVQGAWGRGKTDVLARVAAAAARGERAEVVGPAIWINPWQHGAPDLLTPVVLALLRRASQAPTRWDADALWKASATVIRAGLSFGMRATAAALPGGELLKEATQDADDLLKGLFEAHAQERATARAAADPVDRMGERFRELVAGFLPPDAPRQRLLICVDDMDRCPPQRQVALLEALRFLVSAGARATFLIALDPTLLRQAVLISYGTDRFDPGRYLDKIFDLRVALPALAAPQVQALVEDHRRRRVPAPNGEDVTLERLLGPVLGDSARHLDTAATAALSTPDLQNPRIIQRIFARLHLLGCARAEGAPPLVEGWAQTRALLLWLALAERWPALRAACQEAGGGFEERLLALLAALEAPQEAAELARWGLDGAPALAQLARGLRERELAAMLARLDRALVEAGL